MQMTKAWLGEATWETVVSINQSKCEAEEVPHQLNENHQAAEAIWTAQFRKTMTILEAMNLCRRCNDLRPFVFHCSNTFTMLGKSLIEDWARQLDSVDAHILCTTVCHYIDSRVAEPELIDIFNYLKSKPVPAASPKPTRSAVIPPVQQRQPA